MVEMGALVQVLLVEQIVEAREVMEDALSQELP